MRITKLRTAVALGLMIATVMALGGTPARATISGMTIVDNPLANRLPYTAPLAGQVPVVPTLPVLGQPISAEDTGKSPAQLGGCDTVDPFLTVNSDFVSYRCVAGADIQQATITTNATSFTVSWQLRAALPKPGDQFVLNPETLNGLLLDIRFRTPWMDARRIAGSTIDCQRYAHAGPYLAGSKNLSTGQTVAGNNEWMSLWLEILSDDGAHWNAQHGWSHFGPASLGDYLTVADPPVADALGCVGNPSTPTPVAFPGTGGTPVGGVCPAELGPNCPDEAKLLSSQPAYSADRKTVSITVPFNFGYVDNQKHVYSVQIMQPGQTMWDIAATTTSLFNCASTPEIGVGDMQIAGPQGVQCGSQLDWAPWSAYSLGKYVDQTSFAQSVPEAIYGPTCPYFEVGEYTPGQARMDKAPFYVNLGKGPQGQDQEIQTNPLYPDKANSVAPLANYDAGFFAGTTARTSNPVLGQGRNGGTVCDVPVPDAQRQTSSGFQGLA
jgi:hypothetical protein